MFKQTNKQTNKKKKIEIEIEISKNFLYFFQTKILAYSLSTP